MNDEITHHDDRAQKVKCLSCGSPNEGFFCIDCHTLLPLAKETDYFTLLEMEKRPLIDADALKVNFLKISEMVHPDKHYNAAPEAKDTAMAYSSLLNKAYSTLRDPKERIRYIISLETDKEAPVTSRASAETMEFFIEASDVCNEADSFLKKGESAEAEKNVFRERLQEFKKKAQERWNRVLSEIESLDKEWVKTSPENRKPLIRSLSAVSHEMSYLSKLQSLINEMIIALS